MPRFANTVVYRHECECDNANQPIREGRTPLHQFDVDGQPFPWHITEKGATFYRVGDIALYLVHVEIICIDQDSDGNLFCVPDNTKMNPVIGATEFPWYIHESGFTFSRSRKGLPTVSLMFVAESVDTDGDILDYRQQNRAKTPPDRSWIEFESIFDRRLRESDG